MNLDRVSSGQNAPDDIHAIIEIPSHADPVKYEVDKETGAMFVDRFMNTAMHYPCNYGYVPHTLSEDGDPKDLEANKWVKVEAWANADSAKTEILSGVERFRNAKDKPFF